MDRFVVMSRVMNIRIWLLACLLGAFPVHAQMSMPFSYDELYTTFRHLMSAPEAAELAREVMGPSGKYGQLHEGDGLAFRTVPNVTLTEDTLILLSFISPETARKVADYRRAMRGGRAETPAEAAEWQRRVKELREWADAGYPVADP